MIVTGGTIDSIGKDRLDLAWYIENKKRLEADELLGSVPEVKTIADVKLVPFRRLPSHALIDRDWLDLVNKIHEIAENGDVDGLVITHGTNTIEETAYYLNLTLKTDLPVVLVGAMRPSTGLGWDGGLNLFNAVRVAATPCSRGRGTLLVMNDTIFSGRDVTKTATYRVQAFDGRDLGPLGYADSDGSVVFYHKTTRKHTVETEFDVSHLETLPRVDVVVSYVGADGAMIDAAVAAGARGIVSAGTGAGRPTPAEDEAFDRAGEQGVMVCQSSRVGSGRVVRSPGLIRRGFVAAGNLPPWKARVLLSLALTKTENPDEIQAMFDAH